MLEGKHGEGKKTVMKIVYEMGKMYGANRLLPINSAHMDGVCYTTIWDAGLEFVEYLASIGTRFRYLPPQILQLVILNNGRN